MSGVNGLVIIQPSSDYTYMIFTVKKILVVKRSKYQEIAITDLEDFGRALMLDNYVQSAEVDEYIYHEVLVHPAMVTHPKPQKVLIIGGGEGATLREVLKHNTVEKAVMVDIDEEVIEVAKKYLEKWHQGAFDDPRTKLIITDGKKYVEEANEKYDVIILDLVDPFAGDLAKQLYSKEFYEKVYNILSDDGIMVTQSGTSFFYEEIYDSVLGAIRSVFPIVFEYNVWVPVIGYTNNFIIGSKKYDPDKLVIEEVDQILRDRGVNTVFYSGKTHQALKYTPIYRMSKTVSR